MNVESLIRPLSSSNCKTALFLGAGASAPFGFPLATRLLGNIYKRLKRRDFQRLKASDAKFLIQALETLVPSIKTSPASANNIPLPTVLGILNHMLVTGTRTQFRNTSRTVADAKALLEYAIAEELTPNPNDGKNHRLLKNFADILLKRKDYEIGVISTNYDVCVEQMLFDHYFEKLKGLNRKSGLDTAQDNHRLIGRLFDFGTSWRLVYDGQVCTPPMETKLPWYKLHGSLNWLRCDQCEHIYVNPDWPIATISIEKKSDANTCHCGYYPLTYLLVTPSLVRDIRETNLLQIWRHSLELLRTADKWIFIGYSLPLEDIAIRSILQRAFNARGKGKAKPEILVVDYAKNGTRNIPLEKRYLELFSRVAFKWSGVEELIRHPSWLIPVTHSTSRTRKHCTQ